MSSTRPTYSLSSERGWCANRIIFLIADSAMHSPMCWTFSAVILTFSFMILSWFFIFYTSRFLFRLSAGSGEHRSGGIRAHSEWGVQMSTRGIVPCQYTKKYCLWIKKKPSSATWLSRWLFHFSVIFFHVDSCESYATLDTPRGEKSGNSFFDYYSILNRAKKVL